MVKKHTITIDRTGRISLYYKTSYILLYNYFYDPTYVITSCKFNNYYISGKLVITFVGLLHVKSADLHDVCGLLSFWEVITFVGVTNGNEKQTWGQKTDIGYDGASEFHACVKVNTSLTWT